MGFLRSHLRTVIASLAALAIVVPLAWMWQASLLPSTYDVAEMGYVDLGGGSAIPEMHHGGMPVAELIEDTDRPPDVRFDLTVRQDGDSYTVNGQSPGPLLRARVGQLVEVHLRNDNVADGVTLHWHGVDVPNAEDGVAGVTQDAVGPGEEFTYRWIAPHEGTYWYHSHQVSHVQVQGGLLGPIVIDPARPLAASDEVAAGDEVVAVLHNYGQGTTINGKLGVTPQPAPPGGTVRVRVINTDNGTTVVWAPGAQLTVAAIDGYAVHAPTPLGDTRIEVPAGGRVDLLVTVPAAGVRLQLTGSSALVLGADPTGGEPTQPPRELFDPLGYGTPAELPFDADHPDRSFDYRIGRRPGFLDGMPGMWWTINGHLFPNVPMYMVTEGDVVRFHLENNSSVEHPMHLHGHHAVVLSRDGVAATGSPWWVDSLSVQPGESYEIAFMADNPGIWMDHCHKLPHAVQGLVAHLMYVGVTSSFRVGGTSDNQPE